MSRKPKKGYFVRGQFVAEGSELDLQLKAELKGTPDASRTDLKRESDELQDLGKELLTLRADLFDGIGLPEKLAEAIHEARRITNFEGKRRQMQYVGKLMRKVEPAVVDAACQTLEVQRIGSAIAFVCTERIYLVDLTLFFLDCGRRSSCTDASGTGTGVAKKPRCRAPMWTSGTRSLRKT